MYRLAKFHFFYTKRNSGLNVYSKKCVKVCNIKLATKQPKRQNKIKYIQIHTRRYSLLGGLGGLGLRGVMKRRGLRFENLGS